MKSKRSSPGDEKNRARHEGELCRARRVGGMGAGSLAPSDNDNHHGPLALRSPRSTHDDGIPQFEIERRLQQRGELIALLPRETEVADLQRVGGRIELAELEVGAVAVLQ